MSAVQAGFGGVRSVVRLGAGAAVVALITAGFAGPVGIASAGAGAPPAPSCRNGAVSSTPNPGNYNELEDIAAVTAADVWAVGTDVNPDKAIVHHETLVEHLNGKKWSVVKSPDPASSDVLFAVTAISATDLWAVGYTANIRQLDSRPLIEHSNGSSWSVVASPGTGFLDGVAGTSVNDVWAVGMAGTNGTGKGENLVEHWNGKSWEKIRVPDPGAWANGLASITALSPDDAWAVGGQRPNENTALPLVEHWNGTRWSIVPAPPEGISSGFADIGFAGADDAWAVGWYEEQGQDGTLTLTLTEHWNGAKWSIVPSPSPTGDDNLASMAAVSPTDVWAVGTSAENAPFVLQWDGHEWTQISVKGVPGSATLLFAVSALGPTDLWTAGLTISEQNYGDSTFAEHICPAG